MTQEEKARAYDEVLNKLRHFIAKGVDPLITRADVQDFFPELKESEDEITRKELISFLEICQDTRLVGNRDREKWIAWLEKQGELVNSLSKGLDNAHERIDGLIQKNNSLIEQLEKQGEQKPTDTVKPKFKVGDIIKHNKANIICKVLSANVGFYRLMNILGGDEMELSNVEKNFHLWTIQDARDGDVLKEDSCIFIIERMKPNGTAIVHCCLFDDGDFDLGSTLSFDIDSTYPATKEQRTELFLKMREAGYEWDAEKKELKKIEKRSSWSEEDENRFNNLIFLVECSDENEPTKKGFIDFINRLKSLRPQSQWKPSDEQMMALLYYCSNGSVLTSLYNDLKKL